jgi:hypothetical protein
VKYFLVKFEELLSPIILKNCFHPDLLAHMGWGSGECGV